MRVFPFPELLSTVQEQDLMPEYWWPYLYQYGVGLVIFVIGLTIALKSRACILSRREDRFWLGVLIVGFLWYAGFHLVWYLVVLSFAAPAV